MSKPLKQNYLHREEDASYIPSTKKLTMCNVSKDGRLVHFKRMLKLFRLVIADRQMSGVFCSSYLIYVRFFRLHISSEQLHTFQANSSIHTQLPSMCHVFLPLCTHLAGLNATQTKESVICTQPLRAHTHTHTHSKKNSSR